MLSIRKVDVLLNIAGIKLWNDDSATGLSRICVVRLQPDACCLMCERLIAVRDEANIEISCKLGLFLS